ncbi:f2427f4d-c243-4748-9e87-088afa891fec [Thermothielavioides terrestris]|uniref:F2427f4d-c243-4748-9e87-088afa891fec n=1 Tax=Thermothielavioides terrestris TaxID=2587410 RepID=A0A446BR98_9PEZI|nr:f2427f4d-c243-4748-9e87-088afa891fec [Thermothielavioides terrestris]
MKSAFLGSLYCVLMLVGLGLSTDNRMPPKAPGLSHLYTVNITGGDAVPVGPGPRGTRLVVPILGGNFAGPKLKGTVLPIGADWALTDANGVNGSLTANVRQTFKTDDGAFIQVFETGEVQPDGSAFVRLAYETGSEAYYWLNTVVAIGIIHNVDTNHLTIDTWQMTAP